MSDENKLLWAEIDHLKQRAEDRNTHYREIVGVYLGCGPEATSSISTDGRLRAVEGETSSSKSADVESKVDRSRLNTRVGELESKLSTLDAARREAEARQAATNVEIETQFCAADSFRNLTHATDMRVIQWFGAERTQAKRIQPTTLITP